MEKSFGLPELENQTLLIFGGINTYVAGTGKYKKMIGIKCPYGVQYHEDAVWYTHKCKLNE